MTPLKVTSRKKASNSNDYLYDVADDLSVPPQERVYVDRNLRLSSIAAVGFDLDHTLAHYDQYAVGELAFSATINKLVEKKAYPENLLTLSYNPDFAIRGLVIDLERGNILKMDCHDYVQRAFHGRKSLSSPARKKIYSSKRFSFSNSTYSSIDTIFHLPEACLFASLIESLEKPQKKLDYRQLFFDVRNMIDEAHSDGSIKTKIMSNSEHYIKAEPLIFDVFDRLNESGKKLFLLTNSEPEYTDSIMKYILSLGNARGCWKDYFDIIITKANKPAFFSKRRLKKSKHLVPSKGSLDCANGFELERHLGCTADKIIYFGDHTYGDILKAKKTMGWRTGMIVPELHDEIESALRIRKAYTRLVSLSAKRKNAEKDKAEMQQSCSAKAAGRSSMAEIKHVQALEKLIRSLSDEIDNLESICQFSYNSHWGSLFREGKQISRFGHQVRDFACIYMHKASNMLNYPVDHYFQANVDFMPHEFFL